jgi:hypothetical protein
MVILPRLVAAATLGLALSFAHDVHADDPPPASSPPPEASAAPAEAKAATEEAKPEALPSSALVADLGQHVVGVGYQRSFAPWVSGQLAAEYYQPWTQNIDFLGLSGAANKGGDLRGAIVRGRAFFYPFAAAPTGLWMSPFAQAGIGWGLRSGERHAGSVWAVGASVGYSALVTRAVLLGFGLGLQYHAASIPGGDGPPSFSRIYPQVEIQLGYAF